MSILTIILIVIGVVVLAMAALALLAWRKPEAVAPIAKLLNKNRKIREISENVAVKQLAKNPEALIDQTRELGGAKAAREMEKNLTGLTVEQREQKIRETVVGDSSEKRPPLDIDPNKVDITNAQQALDKMRERPKTADQLRAQNVRKSTARKKNKSAKAARKKNRKRK